MTLSSCFDMLAVLAQFHHNKHRFSVYVLSCDFVLISILSRSLNIATALGYRTKRILTLYRNRYVHLSEPSVAFLVLMCDIMSLIIFFCILYQIQCKMPHTRCLNLSVSKALLFYLFIFFLVFVVLLLQIYYHHAALNLLDGLDYLWFIKNILSCLELFPQVSVQWFEEEFIGLSKNFLFYSGCRIFFFAVAKFIQAQCSTPAWDSIPVNYSPWVTLIAHTMGIFLLTYQRRVYSKICILPHRKSEYERR